MNTEIICALIAGIATVVAALAERRSRILSFAPAGRCGFPTSSCGREPMRSCFSAGRCSPHWRRRSWMKCWKSSGGGSGILGGD